MNIRKWCAEFENHLMMKNYAQSTTNSYIKCIWDFLLEYSSYYKEPKAVPERQIQEYLKKSQSISVLKHRIGALKRFYTYIVRQPLKFKYIEYPRKSRNLPIPLSQQDIQSLFNACSNLKHKAILAVMYSAGLRISEVINLKIENIDSKNGVIWVIGGKGNKDRQVPLDGSVLNFLRKYYLAYKPKGYLFNGQNSIQYSTTSIRNFLKKYCHKAGIREVNPHNLRHSFSTHMIESGKDISILQRILGHNSIKSTQIYTHISPAIVAKTESPIKSIKL